MKLLSLDALINQITKKPNFILFGQDSEKRDEILEKINIELTKNFETILYINFTRKLSFKVGAQSHSFETNPFYFFNYDYSDKDLLDKVYITTEFFLQDLLKFQKNNVHLTQLVQNLLYEMYHHNKYRDFFIKDLIEDLKNIVMLSEKFKRIDLFQLIVEFTNEEDRRQKDIIANTMRLTLENFIHLSDSNKKMKPFYILFTSKKNILQIKQIIEKFDQQLFSLDNFSSNIDFNNENKIHNFKIESSNKVENLLILKNIIHIFNDVKIFKKKKKLIIFEGISVSYGDFTNIINSSNISISFIVDDPVDSKNLVNIKDIYYVEDVHHSPYIKILENQIKEHKLNSYKLN